MRLRAIIPCAGASRRMGRPKALLELGGESFLVRIVRAFREARVDEIVVVVGGPARKSLRAAIDAMGSDVVVVENPDPSPGPVSSVRLGIDATGAERCGGFLVHPVDIPGVTVDDVRALVAAAEEHPEVDAVIPSVEMRRGHPVLLLPALAGRAAALPDDKTLRDLLADARVFHVERDNALLRFDVDTPEDLAELERRLG